MADNKGRGRNDRISRREFLKGTTAGLITVTAAPILTTPLKAWASADMTVGVVAPSHCAAPYFLSSISGGFEREGVNVKVRPYSDMKAAAADLLSGKLQAAQLTVPLFLALRAGRGPVDEPKPVITTQVTGINGGAIVVKTGSGIQGPDDLKGKSIASHTPLTVHYLLLRKMMEKRGFPPDSLRNVRIIPIKGVLPAMEQGAIDAFIMPEPINSLAGFKKTGRILLMTKRMWLDHPCCLTATSESFSSKNSEIFQAFTNALVETCIKLDSPDTRDSTLKPLTRINASGNLPPQVLSEAFSVRRSGFAPYPFQSSMKAIASMMAMDGLLDKGSADIYRDAVREDFANQAYKNLGLKPPDTMREETVLGEIMGT